MNERIKTLRKEYLHLTLEQFGARLGVGKTAISNIENGNRNVTDQMFKAICREFHVNEEWLRTGTGDWEAATPDSAMEQLKMEYNLSDLEYSLIREYLKLSESDRDIFQTYFKKVLQSTEEQKQNVSVIPSRLISYYFKNASAGSGQIIIEDLPENDIEIPDIPEYKNVSYAIGVNGSSMEPVYYDGDILLVEATREIEIGDIGIFQIDGNCFVKKLGEKELISLNKDYPNVPLNESATTLGRVIDKL